MKMKNEKHVKHIAENENYIQYFFVTDHHGCHLSLDLCGSSHRTLPNMVEHLPLQSTNKKGKYKLKMNLNKNLYIKQ